MNVKPNNWVEEDRPEFVERIVDGIIQTMTFENMKQMVWDVLYDDLIYQEWADLWMQAEEFAPDLLDEFNDPSNSETSQ